MWHGAALVPLLVGAYFPLQFIVQITFFLNGRDGASGPNGLLLGLWGLLWAILGYAIASSAELSISSNL